MPKDLSEIALGLPRFYVEPTLTHIPVSAFSSTFFLSHSHLWRSGRCIKPREGLSNSSGVYKIHRQHTTWEVAFEQKTWWLFVQLEGVCGNKGEVNSGNDCDAHTVFYSPRVGISTQKFRSCFLFDLSAFCSVLALLLTAVLLTSTTIQTYTSASSCPSNPETMWSRL